MYFLLHYEKYIFLFWAIRICATAISTTAIITGNLQLAFNEYLLFKLFCVNFIMAVIVFIISPCSSFILTVNSSCLKEVLHIHNNKFISSAFQNYNFTHSYYSKHLALKDLVSGTSVSFSFKKSTKH